MGGGWWVMEAPDHTQCDATIAEVEACDDEINSGYDTLDAQFQCSDLESPSAAVDQAFDDVMGMGPDCQQLEPGCSDYLGADDGM